MGSQETRSFDPLPDPSLRCAARLRLLAPVHEHTFARRWNCPATGFEHLAADMGSPVNDCGDSIFDVAW